LNTEKVTLLDYLIGGWIAFPSNGMKMSQEFRTWLKKFRVWSQSLRIKRSQLFDRMFSFFTPVLQKSQSENNSDRFSPRQGS
jgi:hypothetical protein